MLHKAVILFFTALLSSVTLPAGTLLKETRVFAEMEGTTLKLDIYKNRLCNHPPSTLSGVCVWRWIQGRNA